jgi:hypothetical protein
VKAFIHFPKGYNQNANRTMLVIFLDQIPFFGFIFKKSRQLLKGRN